MAVIENTETGELRYISDRDVIPKGYRLANTEYRYTEPGPQEGVKYDEDKNRLELIHPAFLFGLGEIMTLGAKKYDSWNWYKGMKWSRVYGALDRHMKAWYGGEDMDPESEKSHLYHAAACLMFLAVYQEKDIGEDDRPA